MEPLTYVGTDESGLQWMVTDYGEVAHVATRRDGDTWSRPVVCPVEPASYEVSA